MFSGRSSRKYEENQSMRILIIEDDRKIASFLERGLREEGYAVDVAHDGNEGATNAHVYDHDLLIVDIMLPGRNGYEIVRGLRASGKSVPIVMLTARDSTQDVSARAFRPFWRETSAMRDPRSSLRSVWFRRRTVGTWPRSGKRLGTRPI
jgi:CheY-like chemotaxis protein